MCADFDRGREPERRADARPGPHFTPLTRHAREQRDSGLPGGGAGRRDYVGGSGVYPASLGPDRIPHDAELRSPAAWGQGGRGAAGYDDSGRSEMFMYGGQLLGAYDTDQPDFPPGARGARASAESDRPGRESHGGPSYALQRYGPGGGFGGFGSQQYGVSEPGGGYGAGGTGRGGRERRHGPRERYGMTGHGAVGPEPRRHYGGRGDYWGATDSTLSSTGMPGRHLAPEGDRGPERWSDSYNRPMVYDRENLHHAESNPDPLGESYGPVRWDDADPRLTTRRDPNHIDFRGAMPGQDFSYARALGSEAFQGRTGPHAGRGPRGWHRPDERIHEDVCEALTSHPAIDASELEIDVRDGTVTLRGAVEDRTSKRLAEDIAESISGVADVQNEVRVHATAAGGRARPRDDAASRREERMGAQESRR